jgi:Rrf2 family protein
MKLLTRESDYALRALMHLARRKEGSASSAELEQALGVPRPMLRKILQILKKKGLLRSAKGAGGGFSLARKSSGIRLIDVIRAFRGGAEPSACVLRKKLCPKVRNCQLRKTIKRIEGMIDRAFERETIAMLVRKGGKA